MKILQLCHRLPWPPIDGGKKGVLGFVDGYRRDTRIEAYRLLCMCPREEVAWGEQWRSRDGVPLEFDGFNTENSALVILLSTLCSREPFNVWKYKRARFRDMLRRTLHEFAPDIVHFDAIHTAAYFDIVRERAPQALCVLRAHNAEHVILDRLHAAQPAGLRRLLLGVHAARMRRYEARYLSRFDLVLPITDEDAQRFERLDPGVVGSMMTLPAGVDVPEAQPQTVASAGPIRLVHVAAMDWLPNVQGLQWLLDEVVPLLDARGVDYHIDVIGKGTQRALQALASPNVTVHGFVEDLEPLLGRATLAVVPLQVGGGMRVKILDYWARGIPIVSTSVGAEGLASPADQTLLIADTAVQFADAIERLGHDEALRARTAAAGFAEVRRSFEWSAIVGRLIARCLDERQARRSCEQA